METQPRRVIRLHPEDNILVALEDIEAGVVFAESPATTSDDIPAGHKIAVDRIGTGRPVYKYGQIIGVASQDITPGQHVHGHNLAFGDFERISAPVGAKTDTVRVSARDRATFEGIVRVDGRVATRNYIGVVSTVSCSASVAQFIASAVTQDLLDRYPQVDGVMAITHASGCCQAPGSEGLEILQQTLAGFARHPNFGGILLVGLGCETNLIENLMEAQGLATGTALQPLTIQTSGGTRATVEQGVAAIAAMLPEVNRITRQSVSAQHLVLGMECGGSDAYSGITANPALGLAADLLVQQGGTAILSETPEIYGAEHLLTQRAASPVVAEKLMRRIKWWEEYTSGHGCTINNNPTPGNKAGGLTTILEKSLGAVAKGGSTPLMDVYRYAEPVTSQGLVFMDTPGYDVVSITGMIAGGANMICFTSGRGTVCGFKPVPTLKLASNSPMYRQLQDDMDINCGLVTEGEKTLAEMGQQIFDRILQVASGSPAKSEVLGFGDHEFVPWNLGAVL